VTITLVNEFPDKDYCKTLVNLESLKGIWSWPLLKAFIVLPKQESDKLIFLAYSKPYPDTLVFETF